MIAMAGEDTTSSSLAPLLETAVAKLRLTLARSQMEQLLAYVAAIAHWNRTYNLTAIREPRAMLTQHLVDCLAVVEPLRRQVGGRVPNRLLDVGSGAGLPGVVIAIAAPEFEVTCVDSVGKKAAFIGHVSGSLRLRNLHALHARVEALRAAPFDVIASRAFSSLADLVASTRHLLKPGGVWMAMKGKQPDAELAELDRSTVQFHVEQLAVPDLDADRCIAWIKPIADSEHPLT